MAKKKERNAFKAGMFIIISVALIIAIIVGIKGFGEFLQPNVIRTVQFKLNEDLSGLRVGDDVRVGGAKVGIIRSIMTVTNAGDPMTVVRIQMPERIEVKGGSRVVVGGTLTGTSWLNFDQLGNGATIAVATPLHGLPNPTSVLLDKLGDVAPELASAAHDLRTVTIPKVNDAIDKARDAAGSFSETGKHSAEITAALKSKLDTVIGKWYTLADRSTEAVINVRDLFGDVKADFRTTMANLSKSTTDIREKLPQMLDRLNDVTAKVQKTMDGVLVTLDDIKATAANAKELSGSTRSVIVSNRGKLDDMIASLKTAGDNLKFATAEIRRSPWRLLYKPGPGEVANLNLYDSARQFAEGANDLNDAASSLRDALKDPEANKEKIQKLIDRLDKSFNGFQDVEKQLWDRVKE